MNQTTHPSSSKTQILLFTIAIGIGLLIGIMLVGNSNSQSESDQISATSSTAKLTSNAELSANLVSLQNDLNRLQSNMENEKSQRELMAVQLASLKTKLTTLTVAGKETNSNNNKNPNRQTKTITTSPRTAQINNSDWIDANVLIAAGVDESEAVRIKNMYEEIEMQRLYLRDRATREGWIGKPRYRNELKELNERSTSIKDELSEQAYDAYLYATNEPNRVIVRSALGNSPAAKAGIQPGDTLLKYNGIRVYNWRDLRTATASEGDINSMVSVTVQRNGNIFDVFVPLGPLGIKLDHDSINPT